MSRGFELAVAALEPEPKTWSRLRTTLSLRSHAANEKGSGRNVQPAPGAPTQLVAVSSLLEPRLSRRRQRGYVSGPRCPGAPTWLRYLWKEIGGLFGHLTPPVIPRTARSRRFRLQSRLRCGFRGPPATPRPDSFHPKFHSRPKRATTQPSLWAPLQVSP